MNPFVMILPKLFCNSSIAAETIIAKLTILSSLANDVKAC